ncbi:MAG: ferrochelatase [Candidatus Symbiobacter sp.]|nr:ferrochelatase [Candidatus Symbiobacter sp.]
MKLAIVLFNLGAPDAPKAVAPFLINLFSDRGIIDLPQPWRGILAQFIGKKRAKTAQAIYEKMGGSSPLLANTKAQADALHQAITKEFLTPDQEVKVFIAMRYWHPMTAATVAEVKKYAPDKIILLPLYPQFSTTTSGSSLKLWHQEAKQQGLTATTQAICCYPQLPNFIKSLSDLVKPIYQKSRALGPTKLLLSAHGLPKKIIAKGDPYQYQVEQTAQALVTQLALPNLDWTVCYQSRVGPLEWIKPATEHEIIQAGEKKHNIVLCPIAFVSEHSETLVELDIEYKDLAAQHGVPNYFRVPTVAVTPGFIQGLAKLVGDSLESGAVLCSAVQQRLCPEAFCRCAYQEKVRGKR